MAIKKRELLPRLFNVYPGEERNALRFAGLGFLWAFAITCGLKFADALFLLHIGAEELPKAYTLISCGMILIASLLLYGFHRVSSYVIFVTTLTVAISFYLFAFICLMFQLEDNGSWFWFMLKIAGTMFFSVLMTCYWTFIDQYHHLQDAKRLYSLFSSTIFLGVATTGLVMRSGVFTLPLLLLFIVGLFCVTLLWVRKIASSAPEILHEDAEAEDPTSGKSSNSLRFLFRSILRSRFTLLLMASNLLIQLLLVITEYNYLSAFQERFASTLLPTDEGTEAGLTQFLGNCLAVVSCFNVLFGLFVYSRLVRRFGISSLLVITPALLMLAFTGWSLVDSLIFPLIGFFVVEGTLYVIDDNNFNLLLNAVPSKVKYKIRVIIESFFEPIGMLTSAILLTLFQNQSKALGLLLATAALIIALALRFQYLPALFSNLAESAIRFQRSVEEWFGKMPRKQQKSAEHRLLALLKLFNDEQAQLFACEGLLAFEDVTILQQLLDYTTHMKASAKVRLLGLIEKSVFAKDVTIIDTIQNWIHDDFDPHLKSAVHFYLASRGLLHPDKALDDLHSDDVQLRGAAIVALNNSLAYLPTATAAQNRALAAQSLQQLLESDKEEELCMGLQILGIEGEPQDVDLLLPYLKSASPALARTAAQSIARADKIDAVRQAPQLISQLQLSGDSEIRLACLKALGTMHDSSLVDDIIRASIHLRPNEQRLAEQIISKIGLRTVPTLIALIKDTSLHDRCRLLAGRILGRLSLPQLRANLSEIIRQEIDRAYFYFAHTYTIQRQHPDLDLSMLCDVLDTGYQSVLEFIIQLLGVAGEAEDCELLSRSLRSRNPKVRSQVVEALEKTTEPVIFRLLQPLIEEMPPEEKLRAYLRRGHQPLSLTALLDKLNASPAQIDQIIAATLMYNLDLPNWRELLRQQMFRQDELFHHFAYELLET